MSVEGQTEKSGRAIGKSALPSGTDIVSLASQVRKVPGADVTVHLSLRLPSVLQRLGHQCLDHAAVV